MKHQEEELAQVGSVCISGSDEFAVVVYQPHLEWDLTTIALDTPDGRRHDLTPEDALALAELLTAAPAALAAALESAAAERDEED
jgi:hypothetical protein